MELTQNYTATPTNKGNIAWFTFAMNMEGAQTTLPAVDMYIKEITINGPDSSGTFNVVYMNIWEVTSPNSYTYLGTSTNSAATAVNTSATWSFKHIKMSTSKEYLITFSIAPRTTVTGLTATRLALYPMVTDMDHASSAQTSVSSSASVIHFIPILTLVLTDDPNRGSIHVRSGYYKDYDGNEIWMSNKEVKYNDLITGQELGDYNNVFAVTNEGLSTILMNSGEAPTGSFDCSVKLDGTVCLPRSREYILGTPEDCETVLPYAGLDSGWNTVSGWTWASGNRLQLSDDYLLSNVGLSGVLGLNSNIGTGNWTITLKYKTGSLSSTREQIYSKLNSSYRGVQLFHQNQNLYLGVSSEGSSTWDVFDPNQALDYTLKSDTWYMFRLTQGYDSYFMIEAAEVDADTTLDNVVFTPLDSRALTGYTENTCVAALGVYIYNSLASTVNYPSKGVFDLKACQYGSYPCLVPGQNSVTLGTGWAAEGGVTFTSEKSTMIYFEDLLSNSLTSVQPLMYECSTVDPITEKDTLCYVNGIDSTVTQPYRFRGSKIFRGTRAGLEKGLQSINSAEHIKIYKDATEDAVTGYYLADRGTGLDLYRSATWPLNPAGGNIPVAYGTKVEGAVYDATTDTYTISGVTYSYLGKFCADAGPQYMNQLRPFGGSITKDFIATGFSNASYAELWIPDWLLRPWEMQFKVTTVSAGRWQKLTGVSTDFKGPSLGLSSADKFQWENSLNGSSWGVDLTGTTVAQPDTWYWVRIGWTGSLYYLDVSTDGINFTREASTSNSTASVASLTMLIGRTWDSGSYWRGTLDLKDTWLKVNGDIIWRAAIPLTVMKAPEEV